MTKLLVVDDELKKIWLKYSLTGTLKKLVTV
jgi:hypothetical protein